MPRPIRGASCGEEALRCAALLARWMDAAAPPSAGKSAACRLPRTTAVHCPKWLSAHGRRQRPRTSRISQNDDGHGPPATDEGRIGRYSGPGRSLTLHEERERPAVEPDLAAAPSGLYSPPRPHAVQRALRRCAAALRRKANIAGDARQRAGVACSTRCAACGRHHCLDGARSTRGIPRSQRTTLRPLRRHTYIHTYKARERG